MLLLHLAILVQYRLVTDGRTNRHTTTTYTALSQRRAVKIMVPIGGRGR